MLRTNRIARSIRTAAALAAGMALLASAGSANAAISSRHVSYAPHVDRNIVHTRSEGHGMQLATWYGPGFWGNQTACGIVLTPDLLGVAHRTLPCGTPVAIDYQGRSIVVPVIDRGPYGVAGADWDLTQATAFTLGMSETSTVGALRLKPTAH